MSKIDTSSWKKFRLCDLFEKIKVEKIKGKANDFPMEKDEEFCIPLLTAGVENQGLARFARREDCPTILKNVISISANGANTGATFYQDNEFAVLQDSYAIKLIDRDIPSKEIGLFLASSISKAIKGNYDWSNKASWNKIKNNKILLPVDENVWNPDWKFMEKYIAELEAERLQELEAYLITTGLNDYELNDEDKAALCVSDEKYIKKFVGEIIWKKVNITDLFTIYHGKRLTKSKRNSGSIPFITAGKENYGIAEYIGNDVELYNSPITVDMFGNCFYHNGIVSGDDNIYFYVGDYDEKVKLYITSLMAKSINGKYSYSKQFRQSDANSIEIELPFDENGNIHTIYIYIYIRAIQKLNIKEVVLWKNHQLEILRKIVLDGVNLG